MRKYAAATTVGRMTSGTPFRFAIVAAIAVMATSVAWYAHAQAVYRDDSGGYRDDGYGSQDGRYGADPRDDRSYSDESYGSGSAYNSGPPVRDSGYDDQYQQDGNRYDSQPGEPYEAYGGPDNRAYGEQDRGLGTFSENEIKNAGHKFFGSISKGLANAIEYVFQNSGRPNGYILGEDAGGAFIAGLRYGEGRLYTRDAGTHKVYWQGPTVGYDVGAEGSKTMVLVYNLQHPSDIFHRFGGVQGSAYIIGGVSVQLQKYEHVTLAPIRSGVGLRLGANVGYLKYTRAPTWNPF